MLQITSNNFFNKDCFLRYDHSWKLYACEQQNDEMTPWQHTKPLYKSVQGKQQNTPNNIKVNKKNSPIPYKKQALSISHQVKKINSSISLCEFKKEELQKPQHYTKLLKIRQTNVGKSSNRPGVCSKQQHTNYHNNIKSELKTLTLRNSVKKQLPILKTSEQQSDLNDRPLNQSKKKAQQLLKILENTIKKNAPKYEIFRHGLIKKKRLITMREWQKYKSYIYK